MSGSALAAGNEHKDTIDSILSMGVHFDPSSKDVDYFHLWVRYLFGSFIFKPWTGDDGDITLLSSALGFTNVLSLSFGVVVVYYTFIGGALNTAHSGEVLGKNWSTIWMPIRTASGLGLIMPASGIGGGVLSTAQVLMLWLIITGSNAATFLWNNSVDYLTVHGNGYAVVNNVGYKPFYELSKLMVCVDQRVKHEASITSTSRVYNISSRSRVQIGSADVYTNSTFNENVAGKLSTKAHDTKRIPLYVSVSRTDKAGAFSGYASNVDEVKQILSGGSLVKEVNFTNCGTIKLYNKEDGTINSETVDAQTQAQVEAYESAAIAYQKVLSKAVPSAFSVAADIGSIGGGNTTLGYNQLTMSLDSQADNAAAEATLTSFQKQEKLFRQNAEAMASSMETDIPDALMSKWEKVTEASENKMKVGGWASAGLWFIEIGNLTEAANSFTSGMKDSVKGRDNASFCTNTQSYMTMNPCQQAQAQYRSAMTILNKIYKSSVGGSELANNNANTASSTSFTPDDDLVSKCASIEDCSLTQADVTRYGQSMARGLLNILAKLGTEDSVQDSSKVDGTFLSMHGLANPFKTLSGIGHVMNNIGASIYGLFILFNVLGATIEGFGEGLLAKMSFGIAEGASKGAGALFKSLAMTMLPLMLSIFMFGFCLAYMVPLLPVITWINMMVGYLVTVIEATTATPIAIVQMLTPEGQGIVGQRLERAMQLIIVAIMKPSLMIIGLIASISISSIAFTIFSMYFWEAAKIVLHGSIVDFIALISIYTTTAVALTRTVVSIMYNLPTHILEWFAAGVGSRSFGESDISGSVERSLSEIKAQGAELKHSLYGRNRHGMNTNKE
ncbi:DotA/TraY family protein [Vibrio owensii]|uniref:DotA/TraY family protein n=1 Tax=Vibrio harveyi group TaxID=717610 RepID=UPI003CC63C38